MHRSAACSVLLLVPVTFTLSHYIRCFDLEDLSILSRLATMKSFVSLVAGSIAFVSFLSSTHAASNHTDGPFCSAPKPDDSYFSVVGVQGTGVHPRLELRELQQDAELWNMFILAFARFQAMDQTQKTSYYEIAGRKHVSFNKTHLF